MFISSQQLRALYVGALAALRNIYTAVTSQQLIVKYVMADAEAAQLNAVSQGFGSVSNLTYLMCFYHVLVQVHERLKGFPSSLSERVVADIYDLHVASSNKVYDELVVSILAKWSHDTQLLTFQNYFTSVWMNLLSHTKWYSTTKNPVEQFNHLTKRDYILRTKHKIGAFIGLLAEGCGNELARIRSFQEAHQAIQQLSCWYPQTRTKIVCRPARCQQVFLHEFGRSREVAPRHGSDGSLLFVNGSRGSTRWWRSWGCKQAIVWMQVPHQVWDLYPRSLYSTSQVLHWFGREADSCQPFGSKKRRQPAKTRTCVPAGRPRHNGHALSLD
ncbi:hypothetical protein PHMEG_00025583 [Phytophthora megakarya]|uniref:MULE transposase domain-containing protein n=1 Tax=Phytophthora megakarya TaxID=4795 RepID=A0A225VBA0_9STRA|nr:hypothetical protein PHMEG_00025583 [Phytophthora megakarya]